MPNTLVVHGEDFEENFAVAFRVAGGGHQHPENGGTDEDERLAPPPFAETGECLAGNRLALPEGLRREAGDGELRLD